MYPSPNGAFIHGNKSTAFKYFSKLFKCVHHEFSEVFGNHDVRPDLQNAVATIKERRYIPRRPQVTGGPVRGYCLALRGTQGNGQCHEAASGGAVRCGRVEANKLEGMVRNILFKINARHRTEAAAIGRREGLVE